VLYLTIIAVHNMTLEHRMERMLKEEIDTNYYLINKL